MGSVAGKQQQQQSHEHESYTRRAHHAGSWYQDDRDELRSTLESFLRVAASPQQQQQQQLAPLRALIVPHAGYSYSGPTAAYAYAALQQELSRSDSPIRKILVLHPSHHVYLPQLCAVSLATTLETPVGNLKVDDELRQEILSLNEKGDGKKSKHHHPQFTLMTASQDEREHSGEMQYPYLAHCVLESGRNDITVLPVMCGSLSIESETAFGELLRDIVHRPDVLTVVSTDFCHWGRRFDFQPTPASNNNIPIHEFIQQMDRRGMDLIAAQEPGAFASYLKETRNTICGRHAVAVWLRAVVASNGTTANDYDDDVSIEFVRYAQSSPSRTLSDSSVSYAAAVATAKSKK